MSSGTATSCTSSSSPLFSSMPSGLQTIRGYLIKITLLPFVTCLNQGLVCVFIAENVKICIVRNACLKLHLISLPPCPPKQTNHQYHGSCVLTCSQTARATINTSIHYHTLKVIINDQQTVGLHKTGTQYKIDRNQLI